MKEIKGKNAVVTGAGGGIGRSIAIELARAGANVCVVDIEEDVAKKVAAECAQFGVKSFGRKADVSNLDDMKALADEAYKEFGSVEILVNNAGVTLRPFRAHWETSPKDWNWIFSVNFFGVLNGHLAFVPRMIETPGEKHIVNTSSAASLYDIAGHAAYSATKAACDGLSNSAREELKLFDIGVSVLHPGVVRTRITTSNRLMKEDQKKAQDEVRPWSYWAEKYGGEQPKGTQTAVDLTNLQDPDLPLNPIQYINPRAVGLMVIDGILKNKPHISTHMYPMKAVLNRFNGILDAVPDYSEIKKRLDELDAQGAKF